MEIGSQIKATTEVRYDGFTVPEGKVGIVLHVNPSDHRTLIVDFGPEYSTTTTMTLWDDCVPLSASA